MTTYAGDMCRVTVVAPAGRADVAVPVHLSVGELLPALVRIAEAGQDPRHGWVVQKMGEEPLDEDGTLDALGVCDGDTLHLRPREAPLPPVYFDDVVDGMATAIRERPDRWRPAFTRRLMLGLTGCALVVALAGLLLAGLVVQRLVAAGVLTAGLAVGAVVCSRVLGEAGFTRLLGFAAVAFGAVTGLLTPAAFEPDVAGQAAVVGVLGFSIGPVGAAQVLTAGTASAVVAVGVLVGARVSVWAFVAATATAAGVAVAGLCSLAFELTGVQSAGVLAVLAVVAGYFGPTLAARLVRLRLPLLPADSDELQEEIDPLPGREVVARTARADSYLNGLFVTTGLLCSGGLVVLARGEGWAPATLVAVVGAAMLLRSRVLVGAWQRLSAVLPGVAGSALLVLAFVDGPVRAVRLVAVGALAACLLFATAHLPGRRLLPLWGRLADISETVMGLAAVPILLQVLGVYAWARGLAG